MGKKKDKKRDEALQASLKRAMERDAPDRTEVQRKIMPITMAAVAALRLLHKKLDIKGNDDTHAVMLAIKPKNGPMLIMANETHERWMKSAGLSEELNEMMSRQTVH